MRAKMQRKPLLASGAVVALATVATAAGVLAHDEGPAHHSPLPAHATGVMKKLYADRLPPQDLAAVTGGTRDECPDGGGFIGPWACLNVDLAAFLPLADIGGTRSNSAANDIWGWTDPDSGREFAIVGRVFGTSFVEVTDPVNPVYLGELPTHGSFGSTWRDIKVFADHAYIVSEALGHGMQVFDLTQLLGVQNPPVTFAETAHYNKVSTAHNIVINEETGYAYVVGAAGRNSCSGGLHMVDISNPINPTFAGCFSADGYTHDAQCVIYSGLDARYEGREICFNSNEDTLTIVDVTNKSSPSQIFRDTYDGVAYTHQAWLTEDQNYLLMDDELDEQNFGHGTRTRVWDLSNLQSPSVVTTYEFNTAAIDHNLYTNRGYALEANYRSGLRILDIATPTSPIEVGYFDVYPDDDSANFNGAWSNYPYFPSGTVVVSGIEQGLFVLRPTLADWPDSSSGPSQGEALHVGDLTGASTFDGQKGGKWLATVTVRVYDAGVDPAAHDADEDLEAGVTVDGSWSGGASGSGSCTTGVNGACTISTVVNRRSLSATFTVDMLTRGSDSYDSSSDHPSSIVISSPTS